MKTMAYYFLSDIGGPKYYRLSSFSLCQGQEEQKNKQLCVEKRTRTGLYFENAQSKMGPLLFWSSKAGARLPAFFFFSLYTPPANDSDVTEKGSKQQGLKTKAPWRRGDISDPVPSTFIVSHLLATPLLLLLSNHPTC